MEFNKFLEMNHKFFPKIPSLLLGIFALSCVVITQIYSVSSLPYQKELISPPEIIDKLAFGFHEALADILWIRTVQDFDYCEQSVSENVCVDNSWLYKMLDTITNLSPYFRIPYAAGSLALTVIITDIEGATKIFDKAIMKFPKDWPILYRAGYHYLYEVKDKKRAAELFIQAGENGAPPWVFSLAGRLYVEEGSRGLAEAVLQGMIETGVDEAITSRLKVKLLEYQSKAPEGDAAR